MSEWSPAYHVEADDDPDNEPAKGPTVAQREGQPTGEPKGKAQGAPVGLTLNLPPEFVSAMWGYGDQVMRLAMAVEENTKALREAFGKKEPDDANQRPDAGNPPAPGPLG